MNVIFQFIYVTLVIVILRIILSDLYVFSPSFRSDTYTI